MLRPVPSLSDWANFYVIVGSSSAALCGLQFVVIALGAEAETVGGEKELNAFASPTVVHFCAVLLIAGIISIPGQTAKTLGLCLTASGIAGVTYVSIVIARARRVTEYVPVFEDWLWHCILPMISYVLMLIAGIVAFSRPAPALYVLAFTALLLLFVGIHNAWDAAIFMYSRRKQA